MKKVHNDILSMLFLQFRIVNRKAIDLHATLRLKSLQCYSFEYIIFFFFSLRKAIALAFIGNE